MAELERQLKDLETEGQNGNQTIEKLREQITDHEKNIDELKARVKNLETENISL